MTRTFTRKVVAPTLCFNGQYRTMYSIDAFARKSGDYSHGAKLQNRSIGRFGGRARARTDCLVFKTVGFCHESSLQDDSALFVSLLLLRRKLVDPSQLVVTLLAGNISDHVSSSQHDPVLNLTEGQVDDPVEEEGSPRCSCKSGRDQFTSVCQGSVAFGTTEQPGASQMIKKQATHICIGTEY